MASTQDRVEVYTKCLNSMCMEQCQHFRPREQLLSLSSSAIVGNISNLNFKKQCINCGCYEHQHLLQGYIIGGVTFVSIVSSAPPQQQQQQQQPPSATSQVPRYFPTESSSSPPFSSSSSEHHAATTPNRKMTFSEAREYASVQQQQRNNNEAAIKEDMDSAYSFRRKNTDNSTVPAAPPQRYRGGGRGSSNSSSSNNRKRPIEPMSAPPTKTVIPPLDIFLLRPFERAPLARDGTLRNLLISKGQLIEKFRYQSILSVEDFYRLYVLNCGINDLFNAAANQFDFFFQTGPKTMNKLDFSSDNWPSDQEFDRMAVDCCGANSTSSKDIRERMIVVAPRLYVAAPSSSRSTTASHNTNDEENFDNGLDYYYADDVSSCPPAPAEEERRFEGPGTSSINSESIEIIII